MATTRCKFRCVQADAEGIGKVALLPVYSGSDENKSFWEATPSGSIDLWITNPAGKAVFEVGKEYYVDFIPAST